MRPYDMIRLRPSESSRCDRKVGVLFSSATVKVNRHKRQANAARSSQHFPDGLLLREQGVTPVANNRGEYPVR